MGRLLQYALYILWRTLLAHLMSITHDDRIAHLKQQLAAAEAAKAVDQQSQNSAAVQSQQAGADVLSFCHDGLDLGFMEIGGQAAEQVQQPVSASPMSSVVSSVLSPVSEDSLAKSKASSKKKSGNSAYKALYRADWWQVESRASDLLQQVRFKLFFVYHDTSSAGTEGALFKARHRGLGPLRMDEIQDARLSARQNTY